METSSRRSKSGINLLIGDFTTLAKVAKGVAAIKQISQMLSDLCLGPYLYEAFTVLRASLFLSSLLANSEAWVGLTKKNIKDLEAVDAQLLRTVFSSDLSKHSRTPVELLYLETGTIPIRFILMSRRLNFLWYLLNQDKKNMLSQFFRAQCDSPTRGDWVSSVQQDLKDLELDMDFDQIEACTKETFKEQVKKHIKVAAFKMLINIQKTHIKSRSMEYNELVMQKYLCSENNFMTNKEKRFAFTARAHMLKLKGNFKEGKTDIKCSFGCDNVEDQKHLYYCPELEDAIGEEVRRYEDIYGNDLNKVKRVTQRLMKKFRELTTSVNRQSMPCSATAETNIIDDDNLVNVSVVDLDL